MLSSEERAEMVHTVRRRSGGILWYCSHADLDRILRIIGKKARARYYLLLFTTECQ
jgi:hypothetical protein